MEGVVMSGDESASEFSRWLTAELERRNLRPEELAAVTGLSKDAITSWMSGRRTRLHHRSISALATGLNVTVNEIRARLGMSPVNEDGAMLRESSTSYQYQSGSAVQIIPLLLSIPNRNEQLSPILVRMSDVVGITHPVAIAIRDNSLERRGISPPSYIIFDTLAEPGDGDLVAAEHDGEIIVREWWEQRGQVILRAPAISDEPIYYEHAEDVETIGVGRTVMTVRAL